MAIIGMGCRFPGARDCWELWELLLAGGDAVGEIPAERFDAGLLLSGERGAPGRLPSRRAGTIAGIDTFDAGFFGIPAREAERMDPQHRLLLETAWEAMEDAGLSADRLRGTRTGVFVGSSTSDYEALQSYRCDPATLDLYVVMGGRSLLAQRLSRALDLRGPSLALDSACSSSLVAVHLACQSLRAGESEMAFAAGFNVVLSPDRSLAYARAGMLSPEGRCGSFDASASGFVRSDGAGVVLLKPLSAALRDGDPVAAVIAGSATNNDGRASDSSVRPAAGGIRELLRLAHRAAGTSPAEVGYVECHGVGSPLADAVEVRALQEVLADGREPGRPCAIGSVKANIGYPEGASGVAGLIKTALVLRHGVIPPTVHFARPNPEMGLDERTLRVRREAAPWTGEDRLAGVTSFGLGGTNAHVLLRPAPSRAEAAAAEPGPVLLPLSARSPAALRGLAAAHAARLERDGQRPPLRDVAYTLGARRTHHEHRAAFVAASEEEWRAQLLRWLDGGDAPVPAGEDARAAALRALGARYERGEEVEWGALYPSGACVPLPAYPWQRERHWRPEAAWGASPAAPARGPEPADDAGEGWTDPAEATPEELLAAVGAYLREQAGEVLRLTPGQAAALDDGVPLVRLGLDSLMTVQFRNRVAADLGAELPSALLLGHSTLGELAGRVSDALQTAAGPAP
uniref:Polyketide synthase n=1 Tax=uncultured bacterium AB_1383 TaxID=1630010 RepID=A0A0E3M0B1_9BACT|nr:polyketide synthase [uncultured bacterium AB_1383]